MSTLIRLALAASFKTQTVAEQAEVAVTVSEGEGALDYVKGNLWAQAVASVVTAGSLEKVAQYHKDFETEYKARTKAKKMPGWYRSSKSVIGKALENAVQLLDEGGLPRGKTAVEKDIKELKEGNTPLMRIAAAFKTIATNLDHDDFDADKDTAAVLAMWRELGAKLEEVKAA